MTQTPYAYKRIRSRRYTFVSSGKIDIRKVVDFIPLDAKNMVNLGFGDLKADGSIDDRIVSNNGDIIKILATIVDIVKHYTSKYPSAVIFFTGSTDERTRLYRRILKMYFQSFYSEFAIYGIVGTENNNRTVHFDPGSNEEYLAFLIKRIK